MNILDLRTIVQIPRDRHKGAALKRSWIPIPDNPLTALGLALEVMALWFLVADRSFVTFTFLLFSGALLYRVGRRPARIAPRANGGTPLSPSAPQDDPCAWTEEQRSPRVPELMRAGQTPDERGKQLHEEGAENLAEGRQEELPIRETSRGTPLPIAPGNVAGPKHRAAENPTAGPQRLPAKARPRRIVLGSALLLAAAITVLGLLYAKRAKLTTRDLVESVRPAIVLIETTTSDGKPFAKGSGFFLGTSNAIVTNVHVLRWAAKVSVKMSDGVRYAATRVSEIDLGNDICLLTVPGLQLRGLPLASRGSVAVGDPVLVAGNPRGLEATFSRGIVSAIRSRPDRIQIDAPISAGSSGGPVMNEAGEVIGVATSSLRQGQNLNFAVPLFKDFTFRRLDWPIEAASKLAVSDAELDGLKGRPRLVKAEQTLADTRTHEIEGRPVFLQTTKTYNEDGMVVFENHTYAGHASSRGVTTEYWEATIPKKRVDGGEAEPLPPPGYEFVDEQQSFSWLEGARKRMLRVRYGESEGQSGLQFDSFSNVVESTMHGSPVDSRDKHVYRSVFRFDDERRVVEETSLIDDRPVELIRHNYEVDSSGNWITDTAVVSPWGQTAKPVVRWITRRTISYWQ